DGPSFIELDRYAGSPIGEPGGAKVEGVSARPSRRLQEVGGAEHADGGCRFTGAVVVEDDRASATPLRAASLGPACFEIRDGKGVVTRCCLAREGIGRGLR